MLGSYKEIFAICKAVSLENCMDFSNWNHKVYHPIINPHFNEICH